MLALKTKLVRLIDNTATGLLAKTSRENKGVRQNFVADAMGISSAYLSQLESGRRDWSEELVIAYATAIGETYGPEES